MSKFLRGSVGALLLIFLFSCSDDTPSGDGGGGTVADDDGLTSTESQLVSIYRKSLDKYPPMSVGLQKKEMQKNSFSFQVGDVFVSCDIEEVVRETIVKIEDDTTSIYRETLSAKLIGDENTANCQKMIDENEKVVLALVKTDTKESLLKEMNDSLKDEDIKLKNFSYLGGSRYRIIFSVTIDELGTLDFESVKDFDRPEFISVESVGAPSSSPFGISQKLLDYAVNVDTSQIDLSGVTIVDERDFSSDKNPFIK